MANTGRVQQDAPIDSTHAFTAGTVHALTAGEVLRLAPLPLAQHLGWLVAHALVAWLLVAVPAVAVMTLAFTPVLRRIPAVGGAEPAE